ncbi:MAG: hypothetical protein J5819_07760, partial [Eubacterium sp.]|nr:hypothetical protein [Eubacterium sp.]
MDDYGLRALYSYTDAKWKKVMSLNATKEEDKYDGPQGGVTAVSGNAVTIEYSAQSAMVGISKYSMDYEYTDGKMELLTPIADYYILKLQEKDADFVLHETMKARIEMDVYDKVEEGRTVALNIKAEDDVKFLQIQRINGRPWYFVQVGENTGWLQCGPFRYYEYQEGDSDYEGSSGYFHNAAYAG